MAKRKKKSWAERHPAAAGSIIAILIFLAGAVVGALVSPCSVIVRPVEMPKVTPQIKPPYQWGQRA